MKSRIASLVLVGTLALAFAAQAIADPPAQDSPGDGAVFTSGDPITLKASLTDGSTPDFLDFYVSRDSSVEPDGLLTNWFDHIRGFSIGGAPPAYEAVRDQDAGWPLKPGTYHWQAVNTGCAAEPCESDPRVLTINPLPAAAVVSAVQVETFLDRHPRRRTRKRRVKFRFSSNVAGASFQCLFAKGWDDCRSPHVFRRLKPGRYKFKARAVVNGLVDPSPVSWVFRILRRRQ